MDAGTVSGVVADEDRAAAHTVSGGVTGGTVDNDASIVHGIAHRVLCIAIDGNFGTVQIGAERIARCAGDDDVLALGACRDIALSNAVFNKNIVIFTVANQVVQRLEVH